MATRSIQGRMMGFVDDLFDERCSDGIAELMEKWKVSSAEFSYWIRDKRFLREVRARLRWKARTGQIFIAKYAVAAAARLVHLTDSRNTETARRACVDVLNLVRAKNSPGRPIGRPGKPEGGEAARKSELTEDQASRILGALAQPV